MQEEVNETMEEVQKLARYCEKHLNFAKASLSDEFFYQCLPLCVIDAVFSINTRYKAVQNVINRFCKYFNLQRIRSNRSEVPPITTQESVKEFLEKMNNYGIDKFTNEIFNNRQRTSSVSGILKTEAVFHFVSVLSKYQVNYLQNVEKIIENKAFEQEIRNIKGQRSGISLRYLFMLTGSDEIIKPDRMILGFLSDALERNVKTKEAQALVVGAITTLRSKYPHLTPRLLDHLMWNYQRTRSR